MHYQIQIIVAILICILFIPFSDMFKNTSLSFKLLFIIVSISGICFSILSPYKAMGFASDSNLKIMAGNSLSYTLFLTIFVFSLNTANFKRFKSLLIYLTIASSVIVIIRFFFDYAPWALGLNTSTEGTFLAIMLPLVVGSKIKGYYKPLPIIAIALTGSSVGIFGMMFAYFIYELSLYKRVKFKLLVAIFFLILIFYFIFGASLFSTTTRYGQWVISIDWWLLNANYLYGTGLGTYYGFGPFIQKIYDPHPIQWFTNAHSDWLQITFELGLIGLSLSCICFYDLLKRSLKNPVLFSSVATFGFVATVNMPLRYSITSIAGLVIIRMIYGKEK